MYGANALRMTRSVKRVSNRARQRLAVQAIADARHIRLLLFGILGQAGGEITVTAKTLLTLGPKVDEMDFTIVEGKNPGESIVRLVVGREEAPDVV